jgi:hypothetical protein
MSGHRRAARRPPRLLLLVVFCVTPALCGIRGGEPRAHGTRRADHAGADHAACGLARLHLLAPAAHCLRRAPPRLELHGGGGDDDDPPDAGYGTYDLNTADPNMPFDGEQDAPWLKDAADSDEERELVAGMREKLVLGQDKWYDDILAAVPRNKQGAYDMHADEGEEDIFNSHQYLLDEEENQEGYLGAVDEEGMRELYPALKDTYAYYARNMSLEERPAEHQFRVGDLVTISPLWRDRSLGNYSSAAARGVEGVPEWQMEGLHNDAELGPLRPDDVGVVLKDDSSLKPYLVRALDSKCYKEGYPGRWVDEWWYIPEALVRWNPAPTVAFAADAEIRVPQDFPSVKLALKNMSEGQSLLVTGGDYRMDEACELGDHPQGVYPAHLRLEFRTLKLRGAEGARSWARMILGRWSQGAVSFMTLLLNTRNSYKATVEMHGGPWLLESCVVRCAGGIALKCQSEANVTCGASELGGFAWPIGPNAASDGIYCSDDSAALLDECKIDMTGRVGGVGAYARDRASLSLFSCVLQHNDHAVGLDDAVTVLLHNCTMRKNRNEAFYCGKRSLRDSYLVLRCSRVDGPAWYRSRLPGMLGLTSEYPGDNVLPPLPKQLQSDIPGTGGKAKMPVLDDRIPTREHYIPITHEMNHDIAWKEG